MLKRFLRFERIRPVAIATLLASALMTLRSFGEEVWIGPSSGTWSTDANWLDGSAPPSGGDPALELRFTTSGTAANNLGNPFHLNRLTLESDAVGGLTISSLTGNSLRFEGAAPRVVQDGFGSATLTSPISLASADGLTVAGTGPGDLTISGAITEFDGARGVTIDATPPATDVGRITLSGTGLFTGGTTLNSGNLVVNNAASLGTGPLTVNGGTLRLGAGTFNNPITLNSTLLIANPGGGTLSGVISGAPGVGLALRYSTLALTLTGASTYTGPTLLDYSLTPSAANLTPGELVLSGGGSARASSRFHIHSGSRLRIEASGAASPDRIGDTTPVMLRSGTLNFTGGSSLGTNETLGALSSAGHSTVSLESRWQVNVATLEQVERGTLLVRLVGSGTTAARLFSASAPELVGGGGSGIATSIIPWAIGSDVISGSGNPVPGNTFLTYTATEGLRLLDRTLEYASTLTSGNPSANVRLSTPTTNLSLATMNALLIETPSLAGSGTLTITSGALLSNTSSAATITNALSFGPATANLFVNTGLTLTGDLRGSGGLTKAGLGLLTLGGANSFTGPLTINSGTLNFTSLANFGADTSPIVLNGSDATLSYRGAGALTLARDLEVNTGLGGLTVGSGVDAHLIHTGTIRGLGGLRIGSTTLGRRITLAGVNTYAGPTLLSGGEIMINSDAGLGAGGDIEFAANTTLSLGGPWTSARRLSISSSATLRTAGFDAALSGLITGTAALTKSGAGTLRLSAASPFAGPVTINGGSVRLEGAGALRSGTFTVRGGGALVLDNSALVVSERLPSFASVDLEGAELQLVGNASAAVSQSLGFLAQNAFAPSSMITLTAPGTSGTTLRARQFNGSSRPNNPTIRSYPVAEPHVLIRGDALGGGPGAGFSRVVFDTAPRLLDGLVAVVFADESSSGLGSSFALYDPTSDAAGVIGIRALRSAEYASGPVIDDTTPTSANFLASAGTTAVGTNPTINSLTLEDGGSVTLASGQTLHITSGRLLARADAATLAGGTLQLDDSLFTTPEIYTAGELTLSSTLAPEASSLAKRGPGRLTISDSSVFAGTLIVNGGALRPGVADALAATTVSLEAAGTLDLSSSAASIGALLGAGNVTLGNGGVTLGTLEGAMAFEGAISGPGAVRIVSGGDPVAARTLSGNHTFTGGLTLQSGRLVLSSPAVGAGPVTIEGGSVSTAAPVALDRPLILNHDFNFSTGNSLTLAPGATVTGPGALVQRSDAQLIIQTPVNPGGGLRTGFGLAGLFVLDTADIVISGAAGALESATGATLDAGGTLTLDDSTTFTGGGEGRFPDAAPVRLRSGELRLTGNATTPTVERIGTLESAGFSTVRVTPNVTAGARLEAAALSRAQRGTFLFRSSGQLGGALAANVGQILLETPPPLVGGIVPYAVGASGSSLAEFVTYDPTNGIRPLAANEFATSLIGATAGSNVRLGSFAGNNTEVTVNSLTLESSLEGIGTIHLASGAALIRGNTVSNTLDFGSATGQLFFPQSSLQHVTLSGGVRGEAGLSISGTAVVAFSGGNTVTGPLTLNGGVRINLTDPADLGPAPLPIVINSDAQEAGVQLGRHGTLTLPHDFQVNSGLAIFSTEALDRLVLSGAISGEGGVQIAPGLAMRITTGTVVLTGANSYTGPTVLRGTLGIPSDAVLGNTSGLVFGSSGTLRLEGPWTSERTLEFTSSTGPHAIDTNGFDATFRGRVTPRESAFVDKEGVGTLALTRAFPVSLNVNGGRLLLLENGALALGSLASDRLLCVGSVA